MAMGITFSCGNCAREVHAWDDGNPYFLDDDGKKHYAYHPNHDALARCIGNDSPHLCMSCGHEFMVDSRAPNLTCPKCEAGQGVDTFRLDGQPCPFCKSGEFAVVPGQMIVS